MKKNSILLIIFFSCLISFFAPLQVSSAPREQSVKDKVIIVIDPGHGGENNGTTENGYLEKEMTMITAQAMYDELQKYDNVEVYLTHTDDVDLSLKDRALFAESKNADFLFSIHYNASEYHTLFGSEVWVSCDQPYQTYGYQFACIQQELMQEKGLFLRGIKTRLNTKGTDYYGIIRESVLLNIPAVIIEHCHVDHYEDTPFCKTKEDWIEFGKNDALAVAKYFGLKSKSLSLNFSYYTNDFGTKLIKDDTAPDFCKIEVLNTTDEGVISLSVDAVDYDSPLLYYDYSVDNGETYSTLRPWPESDALRGKYTDSIVLKIQAPADQSSKIIVRAYNMFDMPTSSNLVKVEKLFHYNDENVIEETEANPETMTAENVQDMPVDSDTIYTRFEDKETKIEEKNPFVYFLLLSIFFVMLMFLIVFVSQVVSNAKHKRRRNQRRNDVGNSNNHNK